MNNKPLHIAAYLLLFVGGLNWGIVGLFDLNLVGVILGSWPVVVKTAYILVGVATVYVVAMHMKECNVCSSK